MTAAERQRRRRSTEKVKRLRPPKITWSTDGNIGRVYIGDEYWAAVEWSEKQQCWCIEDAEGRWLSHRSHVHGKAAAKDEAVALAFDMIRDGRLPSPARAREFRIERLERQRQRRNQQPAVQRREAEKKQREAAFYRASYAKQRTQSAEAAVAPLYEVLNEVFDFADPELWKSNSFAALRPRLVIHVEAAVARLESNLASRIRDVDRDRWGTYRTKDER